MSVKTASQAWLFHSLHLLNILRPFHGPNCFTVSTLGNVQRYLDPSLWVKDAFISINHYYTSRLVADDLATEGSRISATILLTQLAWSILVSAPDRSNTNGQKLNEYSNKKLVSSIVTGVGGVGGWGVGGLGVINFQTYFCQNALRCMP